MSNNEQEELAPAIVAQTPRLTLRHFQQGDLDALAPILGDRKVMHFSSVESMTRSQTQNFIDKVISSYQKRGFGLYAVIYRANQQLIGFCGFFAQVIDEQPEVEIGYRLASAYWVERRQKAGGRRISCRGILTRQQLLTAKSKILAGALNPKSHPTPLLKREGTNGVPLFKGDVGGLSKKGEGRSKPSAYRAYNFCLPRRKPR